MPPEILKRLGPKHHEAIQMRLDGETTNAIAARLGVALRSVERWVASPVFQDELQRRRDLVTHQASEELRRGAHRAAAYLHVAVQPEHAAYERVNANGIRAACAILDRMGLTVYQPRQEEPPEPEEELESVEEIRRVLRDLPRAVVLELIDGGADDDAA